MATLTDPTKVETRPGTAWFKPDQGGPRWRLFGRRLIRSRELWYPFENPNRRDPPTD